MLSIDSYPHIHDIHFHHTKKRLSDLFMGMNAGGLGYVVPLYSSEKKNLPSPPLTVPRDIVHVESYWDEMLSYRLECNDRRIWGHDWGIPMIKPNFQGYGLSSVAYGSKYTSVPCGTTPVCATLDDFDKLERITIDNDVIKYALSFLSFIDSHIRGKAPIEMFHFDGPFSAAGLIINAAEVLMSTVGQPEKLRDLLSHLTDLYISFVGRQKTIIGNFSIQTMHDTWWPQECGVMCEDDSVINLSPKAFADFIVPCYNRLSEAFGGFGVHCCGDYSHLFTALRDNVKNLRAIWINAAECPFEKAAEVFKGTQTVVIIRWPMNKTKFFRNRAEFVTDTLKIKPDDLSVFIQAHYFHPEYDSIAENETNQNIRGYEIMSILERFSSFGVI